MTATAPVPAKLTRTAPALVNAPAEGEAASDLSLADEIVVKVWLVLFVTLNIAGLVGLIDLS